MEQPVLLEMKNVSKEFPGVKALDNVSLTAVSYTHLDVYKRQARYSA